MIKSQTYKPVRLQFWNLFHGCLFRLLSFFLFCRETFLSTEKMLINTTVLHKKVSIQSDVFFSQNTAASTRVRTWGIPKEIALSLIEAFQRYYRINHMCDVSERSAPILRSFELLLGRCRILLDNVRSGFNELKHLGRIQHHLTILDVVWQTCWRWIRSKLDCMKQSLLDKVNSPFQPIKLLSVKS